jgi:DNA-binding winged helix-turn-helix (wHTH) protein
MRSSRPAAKHRVLLAALLLEAGRPVGLDELTEVLWGPAPPVTARVSLQNYVMRLRRILADDGPPRIVTQPGGYLINVEPGELDISRFESALAAGRAAARAGAWEEAAAARLHALLMTALVRDGQQAGALAAYQAARRVLVDELGAEPGPELQRLQQQVLAGPQPGRPPGRPARPPQGPEGPSRLVGRGAELAVLSGLLDQAAAGTVVISVIAGPEERAARYRSLLAGRRMLVVLDDAASAEHVRPLLPGAAGCAALVTSRDPLIGLVARDGARRLDLDPLPPGVRARPVAARQQRAPGARR